MNSLLFVDDELFNQQSIKEHNRLFDKYCSTMKSRICNNDGIFYVLRSRCKVNKKGEIINVEILGEYKNEKENND